MAIVTPAPRIGKTTGVPMATRPKRKRAVREAAKKQAALTNVPVAAPGLINQ